MNLFKNKTVGLIMTSGSQPKAGPPWAESPVQASI